MSTDGTKNPLMVIGIDPGINGGIAFVTDHWATVEPMPVLRDLVTNKYLSLDSKRIEFLIEGMPAFHMVAYLEQVHSMPGQGVSSTFKFGQVYGEMIGILSTLGIPIHFVTPQTWKKVVLGALYSHDKEGAILYQTNQGNLDKLMLPRHRGAHDGMADALCIAQYGWYKENCDE